MPSRSAALFCRYCWVVCLLPAMTVMLLPPLLRCGCSQCYISVVVCAPHILQLCAVGCRTFKGGHHTPFVSLGNAALATYPNNLSRKSSWVVGRASSTHVSVCEIPTECNPLCGRGCDQLCVGYLRKPWIMAMPTESSRTYHAMISMMLSAVLSLLSPRVARCSTLRVDAG